MKSQISVIISFVIFLLAIIFTNTTPLDRPVPQSNALLTMDQVKSITEPIFFDRTLDAGIEFSHLQGDKQLTGIDETTGPGVCAFDYDNDGWTDLFLVNGSGQTRYYGRPHWWQQSHGHNLYRNIGNGKFNNVTNEAGIRSVSWGMGCIAGDLDNDGDQDLLITNKGLNILYRNDGGKFTDISKEAGMLDNQWSTSASLADYDGDGLLDIYIVNFIAYKKGALTYESGSQFGNNSMATFNPALFDSAENRLYRNLGNLNFKDVTKQALVGNSGGRGLDSIWIDSNRDSKPDLLIVNAAGSGANVLYINNDDGTFSESELTTGVKTALGNMGISAGDFDNDEDLDLAISSNNQNAPLILENGGSPIIKRADKPGQNELFSDIARTLGIGTEDAVSLMSWTPGFYDFNNDGWLDLFMTNGLYTPDPDTKKVPAGQPDMLWINQSNGSFSASVTNKSLIDNQSSRGAAFADFDNDGDIDIYIAHNNDLGKLLINETPMQHWLGVNLMGSSSNSDAIGSNVTIHSPSGKQFRSVISGNGFLSDSEKRLHFGLGSNSVVNKIIVEWPDGVKSTYSNPQIDKYITLKQDTAEIIYTKSPTPVFSLTHDLKSLDYVQLGNVNDQLLFFQWLIKFYGINKASPYLSYAMNDKTPELRSGIANLIDKYKNKQTINLLINSINDKNSNVVISVIHALQNYEEEITIRWLLRLFSHPDKEVLIATANCFEYFFSEEEAVVHRKFLAIPYLIKLLGSPFHDVRIAAARAMGESERYRGVMPLSELLSDSVPAVRATAARSLGLIRERKAIPHLLKIVKDHTQPSDVTAQALIALQRLNYEYIPDLFSSIFDQSTKSGLSVILSIAHDTDGNVVLNQKLLQKFVDPYHNHNNPEIRSAAIQTLISLPTVKRQNFIKLGLQDVSVEARIATLDMLDKHNLRISADLALELLSNPKTVKQTIPLIDLKPDHRITNKLISISVDSNLSGTIRANAVTALSVRKYSYRSLPPELFKSTDKSITTAIMQFLAKSTTNLTPDKAITTMINVALSSKNIDILRNGIIILLNSNSPWASNLIEEILFSQDSFPELKTIICEQLSLMKSKESLGWLLKATKTKNKGLRHSAMKSLAIRSDSQLDTFMWDMLNNTDENTTIRFQAAKSLISRHGKLVIDDLLTMLGEKTTTLH